MTKSVSSSLPVFSGKTLDAHIAAWTQASGDIEDRLWKMAAIAASLITKYGDQQVKEFSEQVGVTASRVYQLAATYRKNSKRFENLSFHHHTLAVGSANPEAALVKAQEKQWSTRQLDFYVTTGLEPPATFTKTSDLGKKARTERYGEDEIAALALARRLKELSAEHPRFAADINKLVCRIELQLAKPAEKKRRVMIALRPGMLSAHELEEQTALDKRSVETTLASLMQQGAIQQAPRRRSEAGGRPVVFYELAGPSRKTSQAQVTRDCAGHLSAENSHTFINKGPR